MSLYLCVFEGDCEVDGIDFGSYSDFNSFRSLIGQILEHGNTGSLFPTLMLHSDSDGQWTTDECRQLKFEINIISQMFKKMPPSGFLSPWQREVSRQQGLSPMSLFESLIDVDGEWLLERLSQLCDTAIRYSQPIIFQ
jgi:hypothetical protein